MPPPKQRTAPDDSRSEASSTRERIGNFANAGVNGKGRRATTGLGVSSSLRDMTTAGTSSSLATAGASNGAGQETIVGMQWSTIDSSILQSYRHAYGLNTPSAFSSEYNQLILSRPGIGRLSPTMARRKDQRRQSKDQLANAVRKHFNGLGIQENEAVVDFLYKVRWQDKSFRLRFAPQRPR